MRFLSFEHDGIASFGAITDAGVVDFGRRYADLRAAIRAGKLGELAIEASSADANYALADVTYLPTIPNPEKIICIGVNYANRNAEYKDDSEAPKYPSVFMRTRESLTGHNQLLMDPPESDQLDYEGEIVIVIGKEGRRIPESKAHEYIAGLTIMNEGTLRDFLRHAKFNVTQGKNFERSGSLGPWLVTPDELDPMGELKVMTRVNGEERQNDTTANLMFPFRYLLSYLSTFYRLKPGDVIATGTPLGAGARFDPPKYLKEGDVVEVEVPGIGVLRNSVATEVV
ncbi:MAG: fumarylacetoacetate hydrolase family protein [Proteobacteria bacterium]|nr:fumarylacetoacetate hydrolase family protein [Pseudomonadota bacterium]MDA0994763.1 fumarylacetoacetate hydrolase family protein [Pseudomonadota bacterium]